MQTVGKGGHACNGALSFQTYTSLGPRAVVGAAGSGVGERAPQLVQADDGQ